MRRHIACFASIAIVAIGITRVASAQNNAISNAQAAQLNDAVNNIVRERGTIESANSSELRSSITGALKFIVEEGTRVTKGDLVASVDTSAIENAYIQQKSVFSTSQANVKTAQGELSSIEAEIVSAKRLGTKKVELATMRVELLNSEDGELNATRQNLNDQLKAAQTHLKFATSAVAEAKRNVSAGDGTSVDVIGAEADLASAHANVNAIRREQKVTELKGAVQGAELELLLYQAESDMATAILGLNTKRLHAESNVKAALSELELNENKLNALAQQLERAKIIAPHNGIVIYPAPRRGETPLQLGSTVRERQSILTVADVAKMQVAVTVNETRIRRVKVGQKATMRADALVNKSFQGRVIQVYDTPEPTTFLQDAGRQYRVIVSILDDPAQLRVGMTAMVDIRTQ